MVVFGMCHCWFHACCILGRVFIAPGVPFVRTQNLHPDDVKNNVRHTVSDDKNTLGMLGFGMYLCCRLYARYVFRGVFCCFGFYHCSTTCLAPTRFREQRSAHRIRQRSLRLGWLSLGCGVVGFPFVVLVGVFYHFGFALRLHTWFA